MIDIMATSSLKTDSCSYKEQLNRSIGPGMYQLQTPNNDCGKDCARDIPADPYIRYQHYGPSSCPQGASIDDDSELMGLNYKNTKCNNNEYYPGKYSLKGQCAPNGKGNPRDCMAPTEDTRLSNPPCTLRGTGWNRWEWLCWDPQENGYLGPTLIPFEWNTSYRTVVKDNHIPCLEDPMNQVMFQQFTDNSQPAPWQKPINIAEFAPGNPYSDIGRSRKTISTL